MRTSIMTLVFTTVDSESAAQALARLAIDRRLAACVQVERIQSTYRWEGALQVAAEFRLMAKTTGQRARDLHAAWRAAHPYEVPAIWALKAGAVEPTYAEWLIAETSAEAHRGDRSSASP